MGKSYVWCEKCNMFTEAAESSGLFAKHFICRVCGEKSESVKKLEQRKCEKCDSVYYAAAGFFGNIFLCPRGCDGTTDIYQIHSIKVEEAKQEQPEPETEVCVKCPRCRGPLIEKNGEYVCVQRGCRFERSEVEKQLLAQEVDRLSSAPVVIDWPWETMQRTGDLLFIHGYGGNVPPHSTVVVGANQIVIYSCGGQTYMKKEGNYPFFYDRRTYEQILHAMYSEPQQSIAPQIGTSVVFVSLLAHQTGCTLDDVSLYGTDYIYRPVISYSVQIIDPEQLMKNRLDLDDLYGNITGWCRTAIGDEVITVLDEYFNGDTDFAGNVTEVIERAIRQKLREEKTTIEEKINASLLTRYGIRITLPSTIQTQGCVVSARRIQDICPLCGGALQMELSGSLAACEKNPAHRFYKCDKCRKYAVRAGEHRCESCGALNYQ